jgi:hypothetical protein
LALSYDKCLYIVGKIELNSKLDLVLICFEELKTKSLGIWTAESNLASSTCNKLSSWSDHWSQNGIIDHYLGVIVGSLLWERERIGYSDMTWKYVKNLAT